MKQYITIEIQQTNLEKNKRLVRRIVGKLAGDDYIHFFYEPELIIRIEDRNRQLISRYLKRRKLPYKIYTYPFAKNIGKWGSNKGYGEARKSVVYRYAEQFMPILHYNAQLALNLNKRDELEAIECQSHTFMNMLGYEWLDEAIVLTWLAGGRVAVIKKYESQTIISTLLCLLIMKILALSLFLMRGLK